MDNITFFQESLSSALLITGPDLYEPPLYLITCIMNSPKIIGRDAETR